MKTKRVFWFCLFRPKTNPTSPKIHDNVHQVKIKISSVLNTDAQISGSNQRKKLSLKHREQHVALLKNCPLAVKDKHRICFSDLRMCVSWRCTCKPTFQVCALVRVCLKKRLAPNLMLKLHRPTNTPYKSTYSLYCPWRRASGYWE